MSTSNPASSGKPWIRFSLRTLLVAMLVLGLSLGWYGKEWTRLRQQRAIAARFKARKAYVDYDPRLPPPGQERDVSKIPLAMRAGHALFGDDAFAYINVVSLNKPDRKELELLSTLPRLKTLMVTAPPEDGLEWIARNQQLRILVIRMTKITPAHYSQIAKLPQLTELVLEHVEVDDESLAGLGTLRQLEKLILSSSKFGNDAIPHLQELKNLRALFLYGTKVTNASFVQLREMKQLHSLCLNGSSIADSGFEHLTDLPLTELRVSDTQFGSNSMLQIAKIRTLQQLELGGNPSPLTDMDLAALSSLTELRSLTMSTNTITDGALVHLESLTNLRELNLNSKSTTRKAAAQLQKDHLPQCSISGTDAAGSYELPALAK